MRIKSVFNKCKEEGRKAFVAYIAAGDPDYMRSIEIVDALVESGIDILELGIPFSDPLADGEANQLAAARAIESGMTPSKVLEMARKIRKRHPFLPLVLFTYLNPIAYSSGKCFDTFCKDAVQAEVDAILPLDLPPEEQNEEWQKGATYANTINGAGLSVISIIAPTTPGKRIPLLTSIANAFIYYVSKEGVTGEGTSFSAEFAEKIEQIKKNSSLPVVVGFGISTPEHVKAAIATGVDGVVVGSAIVRKIEELSKGKESIEGIKRFVKSMTEAAR